MPYLLAIAPAPIVGLWMLAQQTDSPGFDIGSLIAQLGIAGAAVWWAVRAEKRAELAEERERQTKEDQLELLRELAPLVAASTTALESTTKGLERQVEYARSDNPPGPRELRETLERIVKSLESLDSRLPRPPRRER